MPRMRKNKPITGRSSRNKNKRKLQGRLQLQRANRHDNGDGDGNGNGDVKPRSNYNNNNNNKPIVADANPKATTTTTTTITDGKLAEQNIQQEDVKPRTRTRRGRPSKNSVGRKINPEHCTNNRNNTTEAADSPESSADPKAAPAPEECIDVSYGFGLGYGEIDIKWVSPSILRELQNGSSSVMFVCALCNYQCGSTDECLAHAKLAHKSC